MRNISTPRFFMYAQRSLDLSWLKSCPAFAALEQSAQDLNLGEVGLYNVLHSHPARVLNPHKAALFYVPFFEYTSFQLRYNNCSGTTHSSRLAAASQALQASPPRKCMHVYRCATHSMSMSMSMSMCSAVSLG